MFGFMKWALPGLAVAGGILTVTPVYAQPDSATAAYDDLDLGSPAGRVTLQHRIDHAVTSVCGTAHSGETPGVAREITKCRTQALQGAQAQLAALTNQFRRLAVREGAVVIASR